MTAPHGGSARRGSRRLSWPRSAAALVAVAAALTALSLPGEARAADPGYDQMSGVGPTASALTVDWTQGLLDSSNNPIASDNADRSNSNSTNPLKFMYDDFKNLKVTVSQTQDLGHQGITVSWIGGKQTAQIGTVQANFLQMMECYGDAASGPTPEQCEYGTAGLLGGAGASVLNPGIGQRVGELCVAGAVPSTTKPPASINGSAVTGCDTKEPSDPTHLGPCPGTYCDSTSFRIPFAPVSDPANLDYNPGTTYWGALNTDEVQEAITGPDGSGQQQFETLTGVQAPGLGCGQPDASNKPHGCWLVIVPRGQYEPNGNPINVNSNSSALRSSPLSASNWAQRIQIHLSFAQVQSFCPPGTLERQTVGTQLVARAVQSWQLALNHDANCAKVYGYSAVPESTSTNQLTASGGGTAGLAFTTIPIGSEATRPGGSGSVPTLPTILYAPVAISALGFGFNINEGTGYVTTPVKLTPLLLAKALTQSYLEDLPDYQGNPSHPGPAWAQGNPRNISTDPQFHALNPTIPQEPTGPINPLLIEEHAALNQQVWQWIQGDSAATGWLGGTPDASDGNMAADPDYASLHLAAPPGLDSYPRAYQACLDNGVAPGSDPPKEESRCTLDILPYIDNFDSAASTVLTASNSALTGSWNTGGRAPDGTDGWWDKRGVEPLGQIFMWGETDTSQLAAYGLIPAQLCNSDGSTCVGPSTASVTAAVSAAKADSSGLLHVDPAHPGTDAYPLVDVIYAAVRTDQDATALNDYADLIAYAAGGGQTPGAVAGDLPPGYLPLPSGLASQAQAIATQLHGLASASPSPSSSSTQPSPITTDSGPTPGGTGTSAGPGGVTGGSTPAATSATTPAAAPVGAPASVPVGAGPSAAAPATSSSPPALARTSPSPGGPVTTLPSDHPVAGTTPLQELGGIRWALIGVAIAGGAFAGGGALLRSGRLPPWLRRRKLE